MGETLNPAQRAAGRALECIAVAANVPENNTSTDSLQALRAAWIMRRVPLSPETVRAVLENYFGEAAQ